jgi:hypothetical protein
VKSDGRVQGYLKEIRAFTGLAGSERLTRTPSKASERERWATFKFNSYCGSQSSSNKLPRDDLPKIAHRAALSAKNLMIIYDNSKVRSSEARDIGGPCHGTQNAGRRSIRNLFSPWLARAAALGEYRKDQIVFSQGDPADAVFYIQSGKVKVSVAKIRRLASLVVADAFAGALTRGSIRTFPATAETENTASYQGGAWPQTGFEPKHALYMHRF